MYLKQIELIGFKSFAERTRLNFEPGITAIVGPNGCGKTNIVDSIKWAIGEQSAKSLRSNRMEDVIFNGTDERKGIGMAEASLTFDNSKKLLPLEFTEVTVTRRVFRSGEGQYFINKNLCRLKDVDNIFMDTGIGMSAYSVFEQGKIDLVLSSKPEERRFVFEEAAGISKYKENKREALHRLEITEANLVRLNDIIKEIQRHLNSIERSAAKARRYKKLSEELKAQEMKLLLCELKELQKKTGEFEKDKSCTEQKASELREAIILKECKVAELRQSLRQIDAEISALQDEKISVETKAVGFKHQTRYKRDKVQELYARNIAIDDESEKLNNELTKLNGELQGLAVEYDNAYSVRSSQKTKLDEKNNIVKSWNKKFEELNKEINSKKDILVGKTAEQSHIKNELYSLDLELKSLALKERKDYVEISKKEKQAEQVLQELARMEDVLGVQRSALLNMRQTIKDNEEKLISLKDEVSNIKKISTDKQQYFIEKRSAYEILSKQKKELEGLGSGVKTVLENKDNFPGVFGIVNDLINIPEQYSGAINSFLGERAQWVVADTLLNAYQAAEVLHGKGVSQTVFLVLELLRDVDTIEELLALATPCVDALSSPPHKEGRGGLPPSRAVINNKDVRAKDVVSYDKKYEKLVKFLLGRVLVVEEIRDIKDSWVQVTRDGVVVDPIGIVAGGKLDFNLKCVVTRDNIINELKVILNNISGEIIELTEKNNMAESKLLQEERRLEAARNDLYHEEIELSVQERDFMKTKAMCDNLCEEIQTLKLDEQESSIKKDELTNTKAGKEAELQKANDELNSFYNEIEKGEAILKELFNTGQREEKEYTELKISFASAEQKENLIEFKKNEMQKQIDTVINTINKLSNEKIENDVSVKKLLEEAGGLDTEAQELSKKGTDIARGYEDLKVARQRIEAELTASEEILRNERHSGDEVFSLLNERQLRVSEIRLKINNILQRLQNEYKCGQDAIDGISLEGISADVLGQEIITLREKIESMGEVSLMAIEEQDDLVKRYEFLNTQREDLVNAKDTLLKMIAKLNTATKKLFWDTFIKIRENFNTIFCQLFGGGKADLVLIDESDILESGIEIIARPPGKRLQNVSLLSGGEKALTAVALLFSIFKVKPSPFCIMDEIDAPLDDSNIDRFIRLLKEFAQTSQFIIVTHNKRTISAANALYGITMQESGISKVVSVKLIPSEVTK